MRNQPSVIAIAAMSASLALVFYHPTIAAITFTVSSILYAFTLFLSTERDAEVKAIQDKITQLNSKVDGLSIMRGMGR